MALKQIQKLEKPYPITINFSKDLSAHYKNFAKVITALKDSSSFTDVVKMLEQHLYSRTLETFLDKLENNVFDDTADDFISYISGLTVLLEYFKYNVEALWEYLKHFRQRKYILNYDKPFGYLNWHIEQDLFGELKENGSATRTVNVEIFDLKTAKKISIIQIIINLQTAKNEHTRNTYQVGIEPITIEYRYIKADWIEEYGEELVNDFKDNSKAYTSKDLTRHVTNLLYEEKAINSTNKIEFQKYLVSLHNDYWRKEIYKLNCKHKENSHTSSCNKEFLTYKKKAAFCYECTNKPDLNAQRTRIHRVKKARETHS